MAEMSKKEYADATYQTLIEALNKRDWKYDELDEDRAVHFSVSGEDLPMDFMIRVDENLQLIRLLSQLPFAASEDKRRDVAVATVIASFGLVAGNFDYDMDTGKTFFRMTESFMDRMVGDGLFQYLIDVSCMIVDEYNDKLFMVCKGMMQATDLLE